MKKLMAVLVAIMLTGFGVFNSGLAVANQETSIEIFDTDLISQKEWPELHCLAQNIYHEAKSESTAGQVAVGLVVLNRVNSKRYPGTICDVVYQGPVRESWKTKQTPEDDAIFYPVKNKCQFSWFCDGKADSVKNDLAWRKAQEIAYRLVVLGQYEGLIEGATHYHASYVDPFWSSELYLIGRVDSHLFYRIKR
jgi:spore germination cell wall hydrolase CwlJ-like protein